MQQHPTTRNRIVRRAAALVVVATAAIGGPVLSSVDAGAWTPSPDGPLGGGWHPTLPLTPSPTIPPSVPRITLPDSVFRPPLADLPPLPPIGDLPYTPPVDDGGESEEADDGPVRTIPRVTIPEVGATPIDPDSLIPDEPLCEVVDCPVVPDEDEVPEGEIPPGDLTEDCSPADPLGVPGPCEELTPDGSPEGLGYPDSEGLVDECVTYDPPANADEAEAQGQPGESGPETCDEPTDPEVTPVRVESATGSLAFTGSDLALPLAGAGLLGAGGVLAGISVLARRARSGRH